MKSAPTVSVIIPTFNSSETLKLALESVLHQDFSDFEVFIVGDGCTDDSEMVVSALRDQRLKWLNLPFNSGSPGAPRNRGLQHARGEFVAYLGHDDLWFPWHLSHLLESTERHKSDFAFSLGMFVSPKENLGTFSLPEKLWHEHAKISPSNWFCRKSLLVQIGPWPAGHKFGDDRDFIERITSRNAGLSFSPHLSVLKFPSAHWRLYALDSERPQKTYIEAIKRDADGLRLRLLTRFAGQISARPLRLVQREGLHQRMWDALVWFAFRIYGFRRAHRWPVSKILYWKWRRDSGLAAKTGIGTRP
jgi:glycosyltransferase involved in cell wall biosynthesis